MNCDERSPAGEVALPGYAALAGDADLSRRIADVLTCNVSTRKYARVMYRCADEMGISRSAVSRQAPTNDLRGMPWSDFVLSSHLPLTIEPGETCI